MSDEQQTERNARKVRTGEVISEKKDKTVLVLGEDVGDAEGGGVVGIHGTSLPQLLGQAVSHGCVRVSNTTAAALRKLAPLGAPIWITE